MPRKKNDASPQWPADKVERRPLASLTPYVNNARTHSEAQIDQLVASMQQWGWTVPVLVDEGGTIIAGHGRVLAAKKMGLTDVPVMVATGWTEEQKRAYTIADNQLPMNAGWNTPLLALEVKDLTLSGFSMPLLALPSEELMRLQGGTFSPELAPTTAGRLVSKEDVDKAAKKLADQMGNAAAQDIIDVECPHCGQRFGINREDLK